MPQDPRKTFLSWYKLESQEEPSFAEQFSRKKKNLYLVISITSLGFAAFLAIMGARLFVSEGSPQDDITLSLRGSESAVTFKEYDYTLEYVNRSKNVFSSLFVRLRYPDTFLVTDATPAASNEQKSIWNIGSLAPGERGSIIIRGMFTDSPNSSEQIAIFATAYPEKKSAGIDISQSLTIGVQKGDQSLVIEGPKEIPIRTPVTYRLPLSLPDFRTDPSLQIEIHAPSNFNVSNAEPQKKNEGNIWYADELVNAKHITINGEYADAAQGMQEVSAIATIEKNGKRLAVATSTIQSSIVSNTLRLSLLVNDSEKESPVRAGSKLRFAVQVENQDEQDISDLVLSLQLSGDMLDWSSLNSIQNGIVKDGSILWTSQEVPSFALLKSKAKEIIQFEAMVKDADTLRRAGVFLSKSNIGLLASGKVTAKKKNETITTNTPPIALSLYSDTRLSHTITKNEALEEAAYHVQWKVENTIHELESLVATVTLPDGVVWVDRSNVSSGSLEYMAEQHSVLWKLNRLPLSVRGATFEFDLARKSESKKTNIAEVVLRAKDTQTGSSFDISDSAELQ